ncbi:BnaA03g49930D [Brassica napus]|uniref:BnaA03g49930D protein n=1 Tax=Brassica napus TaxID=3708 RepID=A0A078GY63_BRANA|nr:BnaA03g49930D [Brassica napus]
MSSIEPIHDSEITFFFLEESLPRCFGFQEEFT